MIAYEELVVALTNWRINQGLPTSAVTFLKQDTGSVDLELPVADPLVTAVAQEYSVDDLGVEEIGAEEISDEEYAGEELAAEAYAGDDYAGEDHASEEVPADEYAADGYAAEELPTDTYASEDNPLDDEGGYMAPEGSVDPSLAEGLSYDEDTQYVAHGVDQTQEMTIESVTGDDESEQGTETYAASSDEDAGFSIENESAELGGGPATEEVPVLSDDAEADVMAADAGDGQAPVDDVNFGGDEESDEDMDSERPIGE